MQKKSTTVLVLSTGLVCRVTENVNDLVHVQLFSVLHFEAVNTDELTVNLSALTAARVHNVSWETTSRALSHSPSLLIEAYQDRMIGKVNPSIWRGPLYSVHISNQQTILGLFLLLTHVLLDCLHACVVLDRPVGDSTVQVFVVRRLWWAAQAVGSDSIMKRTHAPNGVSLRCVIYDVWTDRYLTPGLISCPQCSTVRRAMTLPTSGCLVNVTMIDVLPIVDDERQRRTVKEFTFIIKS